MTSEPRVASRGRGQRAGIGRAQIVEAARDVEPDKLTMQAVADRLGVGRSALNYHVADRDELLRLVAADTFRTHLRSSSTETGDWRETVRAQATAIRDAVLATGVMVDYFRWDATSGPANLQAFEDFLVQMSSAGFEVETAGRALEMIADYSMAFARDVMMNRDQVHPQDAELREALTHSSPDAYPQVRQYMTSSAASPYNEQQFDFALGVMIAGLEGLRAH